MDKLDALAIVRELDRIERASRVHARVMRALAPPVMTVGEFPRITRNAGLVLEALVQTPVGKECADLAAATSLSERTVKRAIAELRDKGLVEGTRGSVDATQAGLELAVAAGFVAPSWPPGGP